MTTMEVPHYADGEYAIAGWAAFQASRPDRRTFARMLHPAHLWVPACRTVYEHALESDGPFTVSGIAAATNVDVGLLERMREAASFLTPTAERERVLEESARRSALEAGRLLRHAAATPAASYQDFSTEVARIVHGLKLPTLREAAPPLDLEAFLASVDAAPEWLVEGVLEHHDRVLLTGFAGRGKSTFLRQLAIMLAAGIHPFECRQITPVSTLLVDLERSAGIIRRALAPLQSSAVALLDGAGTEWARLSVEPRPEGLDLATSADQEWLADLVRLSGARVVLIGPLYKMHRGDPIDEAPARAVSEVIDDLRVAYDTAWVVEAHSPYATSGKGERLLRPYGASLWERWPEMGLGLRVAADESHAILERWRPSATTEVRWPDRLERGGRWPWSSLAWTTQQGRLIDLEAF